MKKNQQSSNHSERQSVCTPKIRGQATKSQNPSHESSSVSDSGSKNNREYSLYPFTHKNSHLDSFLQNNSQLPEGVDRLHKQILEIPRSDVTNSPLVVDELNFDITPQNYSDMSTAELTSKQNTLYQEHNNPNNHSRIIHSSDFQSNNQTYQHFDQNQMQQNIFLKNIQSSSFDQQTHQKIINTQVKSSSFSNHTTKKSKGQTNTNDTSYKQNYTQTQYQIESLQQKKIKQNHQKGAFNKKSNWPEKQDTQIAFANSSINIPQYTQSELSSRRGQAFAATNPIDQTQNSKILEEQPSTGLSLYDRTFLDQLEPAPVQIQGLKTNCSQIKKPKPTVLYQKEEQKSCEMFLEDFHKFCPKLDNIESNFYSTGQFVDQNKIQEATGQIANINPQIQKEIKKTNTATFLVKCSQCQQLLNSRDLLKNINFGGMAYCCNCYQNLLNLQEKFQISKQKKFKKSRTKQFSQNKQISRQKAKIRISFKNCNLKSFNILNSNKYAMPHYKTSFDNQIDFISCYILF